MKKFFAHGYESLTLDQEWAGPKCAESGQVCSPTSSSSSPNSKQSASNSSSVYSCPRAANSAVRFTPIVGIAQSDQGGSER